MKSTADNALLNALDEIIALSVENQIKLEALEQVWIKTNPLVHELLGRNRDDKQAKGAKMNSNLTKALMEMLKGK